MTLRIWLVAVAILLLAGLSGCGEELPEAVPSAAPAPNTAKLTAPVLPAPTAVEELRSDEGRSVAAVGAARPWVNWCGATTPSPSTCTAL